MREDRYGDKWRVGKKKKEKKKKKLVEEREIEK